MWKVKEFRDERGHHPDGRSGIVKTADEFCNEFLATHDEEFVGYPDLRYSTCRDSHGNIVSSILLIYKVLPTTKD